MTKTPFDFTTLFDSYRQAFAPVFAAQQTGLKTLERVARYQYAVAGDYLEWALAHAKASTEARPVADTVSQQSALNTAFGEKLRARAQEFNQIASETQGTVTKWFDEANAKVAETAKKAA